jgi:hypothetical protein
MIKYRDYNKTELVETINSLNIHQNSAGQVITKFRDHLISVANVSRRYEIFDIKKYLLDKIELIEKNFTISKYRLSIKGGVQYLTLLSDKITIEGVDYYKSFFILNSTNKSRKLSFNAGLYSETKNIYIINSVKNVGLTKKHLRGLTEAAEIASTGLNNETFEEQIQMIKSLVGHKIQLSRLKDIIVNDSEVKANHQKFDAFKNSIIYFNSDGLLNLSNDQRNTLKTPSERLLLDKENDFYVDAFWAFQTYLKLFNKQDSHIIKNETEKIMGITQWAVRNAQLELLGI